MKFSSWLGHKPLSNRFRGVGCIFRDVRHCLRGKKLWKGFGSRFGYGAKKDQTKLRAKKKKKITD